MSCFPCFTKSKRSNSKRENGPIPQENVITRTPDIKKPNIQVDTNQVDTSNIQAQNFTFRELAIATKNFRQECLMGEGGFGRVYKGTIPATGQVVAVKQLDRNGIQGSKEFLVEVLMLSLLNHENLVKLTGYCADGEQRLLVYEFMPGGSLERPLLERRPDEAPLDWYSRMKIASSAAKGLWYLHDKANPPVIFRDLKSSNILLDNDLNAKLSDYGLAKLAGKDKMNIVPTRVMGTYGYSAPEYVRTGNLTLKSDVYSFGVVLLELITGRRAIDTTRPNDEQNLVSWAQPIFREPKRYPDMADPLLNKNFPEKDLNQVVAIAAMCLQEESAARPLMSDVVTALSFLSTAPPPPAVVPDPLPPPTSTSQKSDAGEGESQSESESESESGSESEAETNSHSSNEEEDNGQVAASGKYQEIEDVSETEYDYYENENQQKYSPQDTKEFYSKSSRKSSTRSRNGTVSSGHKSSSSSASENGNGNGNVSTSRKSSSRKKNGVNSNLSQKSSKKSKSSKQSSERGLSQKSSKKSSVKVLSHKTSNGMRSEDESRSSLSHRNVSISHNSSSGESQGEGVVYERSGQGNVSFGLISSESVHSNHDDSDKEGSSINLLHHNGNAHHFERNSMGSDEGSFNHFEHSSSRGSDEGTSVHSQ